MSKPLPQFFCFRAAKTDLPHQGDFETLRHLFPFVFFLDSYPPVIDAASYALLLA